MHRRKKGSQKKKNEKIAKIYLRSHIFSILSTMYDRKQAPNMYIEIIMNAIGSGVYKVFIERLIIPVSTFAIINNINWLFLWLVNTSIKTEGWGKIKESIPIIKESD